MEVIDIGLGDLEPISLNFKDDSKSVDFGGGIEMFMNESQRSGSKQVNVDMSDLDRLDEQINRLSAKENSGETRSISGMAANLFGFGNNNSDQDKSGNTRSIDLGYETTDSKLGQSTTSSIGNNKTWDGFTKVNDIPPDSFSAKPSSTNNMSEREKRRKKREMLKKLEEWYESGQTKNSSRFNMDSPYDEIEDEYESVLEDKRRKDGVKLQGWWFVTLINSLEYVNSTFDPFGINLDGWGEKVSEDLPDYEEIFSELYEKYKGGKMAPEVSLLMRLGFSAAMVGITNKALSAATPGFNDIIRQSPELMREFNKSTVQALSQQSPGFAFASNLMKPSPDDVNTSFGPPPKPIETKNMAPPTRPGAMVFTQEPVRDFSATANPNNRPDIALGRGTMFRENGVDVGSGYTDLNKSTSIPTPSHRPEMRGPQNDVDSILSGLKMKTVNIHEQVQEEDSMISASSLRDTMVAGLPKKSNRRKVRSEKNSISLGDI